jgi:peptidoglycan-N-acetylglucosamine deacetylase
VTAAFLLAVLCGAIDAGAFIDGGGPMPVDAGTPPAAVAAAAAKPEIPAFAVRGVATREPVVALTFDACATAKQANGWDREIFNILAREQIPATFYLSGRWVEKHPTAVKEIAAAPWVELGNHSYTHSRLTLLRPDRLRTQIRFTNRLLERKLGRRPLSLRPPGGAWDKQVVAAAKTQGLPVVTWTVVSGDVGGRVPAGRMVRTVLDQARPGAMIIFHVNGRGPLTKKALPDIIAGLHDKGLRFVTVSELLALPDARLEAARPSRYGFHMHGRHRAPKAPALPGPAAPPPSPAQGEEHADPPT